MLEPLGGRGQRGEGKGDGGTEGIVDHPPDLPPTSPYFSY